MFIEEVIRELVDSPNDVKVEVVHLDGREIVMLKTSEDDVGQVIGRKGIVVEAIRTLLVAYSGKLKKRVELDYVTEREKRSRKAPK